MIEVLEGEGAGSIYESLSADDKRAHELNEPSFWVLDESPAPNSDLLDNLRTAMGKRNESLGIVISTQAANDLHPLSQLIDDALLGEESVGPFEARRSAGRGGHLRREDLVRLQRSAWQISRYFVGDPGRIRTCDLQLRRLLLYPLSYGAPIAVPL